MFPTDAASIEQLIDAIDPIRYGQTRNYLDGAVTRLSPYISRGVLSTRQIAQAILAKGYKPYQIESFLKELAWRDYFQQVWLAKGDAINFDLKQDQTNVVHRHIPEALVHAKTGITAIDTGIEDWYQTGYMHNHLRMYVAAIACNIGRSHWKAPARWMYYHLLDADWASNALSWQWVAGAFSSKKYVANQDNINKYCVTRQKGTFLDCDYEDFDTLPVPEVLKATTDLPLQTLLPQPIALDLDPSLPIYVYNFYNLDYKWDRSVNANRVLLLEPEFFDQYPVSEKTLDFILALAKNIPGIQTAVGNFDAIFNGIDATRIHYKEHPTAAHYRGNQHARDWMFPEVTGYFPSFFAYWKKASKYLHRLEP